MKANNWLQNVPFTAVKTNGPKHNQLKDANIVNLHKVNLNTPDWKISVGNAEPEKLPTNLTKTRRRRGQRKRTRRNRRK
jgi:hypothetical protein